LGVGRCAKRECGEASKQDTAVHGESPLVLSAHS
jgi:hypothetical protein